MEIHCGIPVVDLNSSLADLDVAANLISALANVGFAYVKNHNIAQSTVDKIFGESVRFFELPLESKLKYRYPIERSKPAFGFIPPEDEMYSDEIALDIREALDLTKAADGERWPSDDDLPGFKSTVMEFITELEGLGVRLLGLIGLGLNPQDPDKFVRLVENRSDVQFRMVDYPQVAQFSDVQPGQSRFSEHTDYGGITLLFQDDCGGLEVKNRDGEFVEAVPMKGTVLVNVGDFVAMLTGGKLKSTPHRVMITEKNFSRRRQSLVLFVDPDGDKSVMPDTSLSEEIGNMQPVSYNMWRNRRFEDTNMIKS